LGLEDMMNRYDEKSQLGDSFAQIRMEGGLSIQCATVRFNKSSLKRVGGCKRETGLDEELALELREQATGNDQITQSTACS
jgi:hypothetical protein